MTGQPLGLVDVSRLNAVLVVEDGMLIRMDITTFLEDEEFTVYEAAADEATAILNTHSEIRAVFTDIDMPGTMDGLKLAAAVRDKMATCTNYRDIRASAIG
ncbi:response regulator [Rhizobium tumorigenes]|uniref:response regulator n=1 Tax=Rhizobium tumorigenes TaxID=2041385 RepID=UPI00268FB8BD